MAKNLLFWKCNKCGCMTPRHKKSGNLNCWKCKIPMIIDKVDSENSIGLRFEQLPKITQKEILKPIKDLFQ